ncbi:MAG: aminopeptidase [Verrucomicrobiota bacterium]
MISLHRDAMTGKGNNLDTSDPRRWLFGLLLGLGLTSCSTVGFYSQALRGQTEILSKARPVAEVLADPASKPRLKEKLTTVAKIRRYAQEDLGLPAEGQYDRYTNLGRRYVVWVIFATPEFSVEAKRWWYPLVGRVKYRGFFEEAKAEKEAQKLRAQGLDVYLGGVEAYSTLGYLRDPLLNTFLGRDDASLAELIFHELTHQRIYLAGDTDFNEALATAVGRAGTRRWLRSQGRWKDLAQYEKEMRVEKEFIREVLQTRTEVAALYAQKDLDEKAMREGKQAAFARMKLRLEAMNRRQGGSLKLDRWFQKPMNNARLNTLATYYDLVPAFEARLRSHGGDIEAFLKEMEGLKTLAPMERRAKIQPSPAR